MKRVIAITMIVVMGLTGTTLARGSAHWPYASSMYGRCYTFRGTYYYGGGRYNDRTAQRIDAVGGIVDTVVWATVSAKQAEAVAAQANRTTEILGQQYYQSSMQTQRNIQAQQLQDEINKLEAENEKLQQEIRKLELELTKMKLQQEMQNQGKTK